MQVDLKDGCIKFRMNTCAACTGLMHPMRPEDIAARLIQVPVPCRGCPDWSLSYEGSRKVFEVLAYGLRAGFVCAEGTMTGIVDEVVCKGGNCTASALGQRMISTGQVS